MLNYYIENYLSLDTHLILYADNYPAQNKNCTLIGYLCYIVKEVKYLQQVDLLDKLNLVLIFTLAALN